MSHNNYRAVSILKECWLGTRHKSEVRPICHVQYFTEICRFGFGFGFDLGVGLVLFLENTCCSLNPAVCFCFVSWFNTLVVACSGLGCVFGFGVESWLL